MKHKTAELEGALLDAAVTLALGVKANLRDGLAGCYLIPFDTGPSESRDGDIFEPSTRWDHGGPVFERHYSQITAQLLWWFGDDWTRKINAVVPSDILVWYMRAYVASKLGDEVELP